MIVRKGDDTVGRLVQRDGCEFPESPAGLGIPVNCDEAGNRRDPPGCVPQVHLPSAWENVLEGRECQSSLVRKLLELWMPLPSLGDAG